MKDLKNWTEVSKGYYRHVIGANVCYELFLHLWHHDTDILTAKASLFIAGDWNGKTSFFERELLLNEQPLFECLEKAVEDNEQNNKET